ncbi:MAG: cytochrome P450 [Myxococcales bacterium]|nr:cytochrome P450 [Myxococcales bacterium]
MSTHAAASPSSAQTRAPLPPALPTSGLRGHLTEVTRDPIGLFSRAHQRQGDVVSLRMLGTQVVSLANPEDWHRVLVTNRTNYTKRTRGYHKLKLFLGEGLVTSEGDHWRRQRRIAQPAFHRKHIETFAESMVQASLDMRRQWEQSAAAGETRDIADDMMRLTLRIAGETLFSLDVTGEAADVGDALGEVLTAFDRITTAPIPYPELWPTASNRRMRAAIAKLDEVVEGIIAQRRASGDTTRDLLGNLMAARDEETGEGMNDKQLRDEVMTMLLAGHETTANALAWTLHLLSTHPEVADKVAEELQTHTGGETLTMRQMCQLRYTDQVLKESMRLYPPVWIIGRRAEEDDEIGGFHIRKGTYVYLPAWVLHRNERTWRQPSRFDPDRFSPERVAERKALGAHRFSYLPFSGGQRKCIGDQFARMEAIIALATLLPAVKLQPVAGRAVEADAQLTLRPKGGLPMHLSPRIG